VIYNKFYPIGTYPSLECTYLQENHCIGHAQVSFHNSKVCGIIYQHTMMWKQTTKYIWTNHLFKNNEGCALVGIKISNDNNQNLECLYSMFANHHICVVLQSSVRHIDG
jgi:hypothetical protein